MIENRKAYRLPFRAKFLFSCGEHVYTGNTLNVSSGGIFITLLENSGIVRESACRCAFSLDPGEPPLILAGVVKRVIAADPNPEILPGVAFQFADTTGRDFERLGAFMNEARHNFELAATILAGGEPDLVSLGPLVQKMQLPPTTDLGDLRFQVERILKAIDLVDANNARIPASPT